MNEDGYFWCVADCWFCGETVYWNHTFEDWAHLCIVECGFPLVTLISEEPW